MKTISLIPLFFSFTLSLYAQSQESYEKLIIETNNYIDAGSELHPFDLQYPISKFDFSKKELATLSEESNFVDNLSVNKDSIDAFYMINYFHQKVIKNVDKLVRHERFSPNKIEKDLLEIAIIFSEDKKLFNFSFEKNTGGSYLSRVSKMYFFDEQTKTFSDVTDNSIFNKDGYSDIYTLRNDGITKYLLLGNVKGCTTCFEHYIQLVNSNLEEEFSYSVSSRDWNDGLTYDDKTKSIDIYYHLNDLNGSCVCEDEIDYESDSIINVYETPLVCQCSFIYDGNKFVKTGGSLTKEQK